MKANFPPVISIGRGDKRFPERVAAVLGKQAPEQLFLMGNIDLIEQHAVSFCGARDASEKGIEAAAICARTAVKTTLSLRLAMPGELIGPRIARRWNVVVQRYWYSLKG